MHTISPTSGITRPVLSLLIALVLWAAFTWPLPRHLDRAVPYGSQAYHDPDICTMTAGDHLQYLYYLVLVKDMLFGDTPLFYNLYEFNTGDDEARYEPDPYYLPFVLLFSLFTLFGSDAFAWNMLGLSTTWISLWATWAILRRYTAREWVAALAATATLALPFRWASLLGGSPMGPALIWTPLLMWGLDRAVREDRLRGGLLAGVCLLFALWTDMHAFFFLTFFTPFWCVVALVKREDFPWRDVRAWIRMARALLPVPLFLVAAVGIRQLHTQHLVAEETRTWNEAALYSPQVAGLFAREIGVTGHIFLGYALIGFVALGLLGCVALARRRTELRPSRDLTLFALVCLGLVGAVLLALGTSGPMGGKVFDLARAHLPFYSNIRQSGKIFCLVPPLVGVLMVLAHGLFAARFKRLAGGAFLLLAGWFIGAGLHHVAIAMTWLDLDQGAYAAVAEDAAAAGRRTGAVIVPLWPGDAHFSSVYQMHAVHYRIKMANGYKPMPDSRYRKTFFEPFSSINDGVLSDEQADALLARGIHYVILHQNMFPEKVGPFPVGDTIVRLMNHPRLQPLAQDERVWSFRILESPAARTPVKADWTYSFPARRIEAEGTVGDPQYVAQDASAGRGALLRLAPGLVSTGGLIRAAASPDLAWLVRLRGSGRIMASTDAAGVEVRERAVEDASWHWLRLPVSVHSDRVETQVRLAGMAGEIEVDLFLLVRGEFPALPPGAETAVSAARFFHAGYMDLELETVTLERGVDPFSISFYGPKWPVEPGLYEVEVAFSSPAADGTPLGVFNLEEDDFTGRGVALDVVAGRPAVARFRRSDNLPMIVVFIFSGGGDITLERIVFRRVE